MDNYQKLDESADAQESDIDFNPPAEETDTDAAPAAPMGTAADNALAGTFLTAISEAVAKWDLPFQGKQYLARAMKGPSRHPKSSRFGMKGRFTSPRLKLTVAFGHGGLGLASVQTLEADQSLIAWFDSPPDLKAILKRQGRKVGYPWSPTFLCLRPSGPVLIDVQPLDYVKRRAVEAPGTYVVEGNGWTCPPAAEAARPLGFGYELWTDDRFDATVLSNARLLAGYYSDVALDADEEGRQQLVIDVVEKLGSPTLVELRAALEAPAGIDHVYRAIARNDISFDRFGTDLRSASARVFRDDETMHAYAASQDCMAAAATWTKPAGLKLTALMHVEWDGVRHKVLNVGDTEVTLQSSEGITSLSEREVRELLDSGAIKESESPDQLAEARTKDANEFILKTPPQHLSVATAHLDRIRPFLAGCATRAANRTERRYIAAYRLAERTHGNGFLGLVPGFASCGSHEVRLCSEVIEIVRTKTNELFLSTRNASRSNVHRLIVRACQEAGLPPPSYSWYCRYLAKLSKFDVKVRREGTKAAYGIEQRVDTTKSANLDHTPIRRMERAHCDHTELDIELVSSETAEGLGRPWLTLLVCHFTRRCLAFFISFEPPSYRAVMMVLRDCVRRYGRLPESIVVDGGKEFRSAWFETVCAFFQVMILRRPPHRSRHGSQGERAFGTNNTGVVHFLTGNTQLTKNVRQLTKEVDPARAAIWTLAALQEVEEKFWFEVYDRRPHTGILVSPEQAWEQSGRAFGTRPERLIRYDRNFIIATCPCVDKGVARVQPDGVKINYFYFNAPELYAYLGKDVQVRYEPYDISTAYAFVGGSWVTLRSRFHTSLIGLTERELIALTEEYRKRASLTAIKSINEPALAAFLTDVLAKEDQLLERKRALELQKILTADGESDEPAANDSSYQGDAADEGDSTQVAPAAKTINLDAGMRTYA